MKNDPIGTRVAVIETTVRSIENSVDEIKKKLDDNYVTQQEFEPIKKLVYGLVGLILTGVILALLGLVIIK